MARGMLGMGGKLLVVRRYCVRSAGEPRQRRRHHVVVVVKIYCGVRVLLLSCKFSGPSRALNAPFLTRNREGQSDSGQISEAKLGDGKTDRGLVFASWGKLVRDFMIGVVVSRSGSVAAR
jgi:hypothetical protein